MNQDWIKRISWTQQASTLEPHSDTTGYKAHLEDIELPVRREPSTKDHPREPLAALDYSLAISSEDESILQPRKLTKSFKLETRPFGFNLTFIETTKYQQTPAYYAVCSEFNPRQPDIVLHTGESKNGGRLAVAYYRFSRHIRMGFGPETLSTGEGAWEEMRNTSTYLGHWRYEFEYNVPIDDFIFRADIDDDFTKTRKRFMWERTRDVKDGVKGALETTVGWRNYRLVEQESGRVLAVMLTDMFTGCSDKGVLNFHEPMSKEMEQVVILTAACICDKGERRIRHYSFGGSGGGP